MTSKSKLTMNYNSILFFYYVLALPVWYMSYFWIPKTYSSFIQTSSVVDMSEVPVIEIIKLIAGPAGALVIMVIIAYALWKTNINSRS